MGNTSNRKYKRMKLGLVFGRLTVVSHAGQKANTEHLWLCQCTCGSTTIVSTKYLNNGDTTSCGCLLKEKITKHGGINDAEYDNWRGMRRRVRSNKYYVGISVCPTWGDYAVFIKDMGRKPTPEHSIERRDNNRDYSPENCYWATPKEQAQNRRYANNAILLTIDEETKRVSDWCDQFGLSRNMVYKRIRRGMSVRLALNL